MKTSPTTSTLGRSSRLASCASRSVRRCGKGPSVRTDRRRKTTNMKKLLSLLALLTLCAVPCYAQQTLSQQFTENIALAPAAVVVGQNFSTTTGTGAVASSTGGSVAAGV